LIVARVQRGARRGELLGEQGFVVRHVPSAVMLCPRCIEIGHADDIVCTF
jgi:hypothetical protein